MKKAIRVVIFVSAISVAIGLTVWSIMHIKPGTPFVIFLISHVTIVVSSIIVGYLAHEWNRALFLLFLVFILAYAIIGTALYGIVLEGPHPSFLGSILVALITGGNFGRFLAKKWHGEQNSNHIPRQMTIDKYVRRYWKGDEKMMAYAMLAYYLGMIAGSIIAGLIALFHPLPLLPFLGVALPVFIGSILAGFFARYRGWLVAFTLTLLIAIGIRGCDFIYGDERYPTSYTLKRVVVGLVISVVAGYLGQLLAQKWHKRSQKKSTAV